MAVKFKRFNHGVHKSVNKVMFIVVEATDDNFQNNTTFSITSNVGGTDFTWTGTRIHHSDKQAVYSMKLDGNTDHPFQKTKGRPFTEITVTVTIDSTKYQNQSVALYDD